ncbi:DUF2520 domain-containing protein [Microbacterium sp. CFH 90308]|uniref:DUF2520 domain-containing protein n=1 Tax=Microbacterium salsuginis TaxID=2722803 RepID=A0ABX1KEJ2_9MICO|nr:Rossmann-like and DUF2520 domain-containing protein [Microbacterium sp. CFH 90308]NLP84519.1 DUF2520 domain-containing protein [Microbacterium sp. CFH 90308]
MPDRPLAPARPVLDGPIAVIGAGRVGGAVAAALRAAGAEVNGPLGRGATAPDAAVVLLAVPDAEIRAAAAALAPGSLVGHFSGATSLEPLAPHEAFSIHPLLAITGPEASFLGVPAAIAGSTPHAATAAEALATTLGMHPFRVEEADRAAYHAAASIASNFLVTLEAFAEDLAATAGVDRDALVPLVRATVQNWSDHGPARALTGPITRGDDGTVARQRTAVAERLPERLALFDALTDATRALAGRRGAAS